MKIVSKDFQFERELDTATAACLTRWYVGDGDEEDHKRAVALMRHMRKHQLWLACSCNLVDKKPPLIATALLLVADTFYLRRLTGPNRTPHIEACPYHRPQQPLRNRSTEIATISIKPPTGYFHLIKPEPETLAQKPSDTNPDDRPRQLAIPKLAKLLWVLLDEANLTTIPFLPKEGHIARTMAAQFVRLKAASRKHHIAPRVPLVDLLFTHPEPWFSGEIVRQLEHRSSHWPAKQEPQAFLLSFADQVTKTAILPNGHEGEIEHIQLRSPSTRKNPAHGPYLCLTIIGKPPYLEEYKALQAYVQPVYSGHVFMPTNTDLEREIITRFIKLQAQLNRAGISASLKRPMFNIQLDKKSARPNFIIKTLNHQTRTSNTVFLDHFDPGDDAVIAARLEQQEILAPHGTVIPYDDATVMENSLEQAIIDSILT